MDNCCKLIYHVKSPRKARSPSAMVFVEGNAMIFLAALDWAESSAPFGSAARMRIEGFMAFAARVTPEIKPPPIVQSKKNASLETKLYHLHHKKFVQYIPLMGTIIVSISGTCSKSSRDTVP